MAPVTARRPNAEEEDEELLETETEELEDEPQVAAPAVGDRRRRRQLKRGIVPEPQVNSAVTTGKDRPTPSQREEPAKSRNFVVRSIQGIRNYLRETDAELRKVAWPTREETMRLTRIVIMVTVVSSIFLGSVSFLFSILTTQVATPEGGALAGIITLGMIIIVAGLWLFRDRIFGNRIE